MKRLLLLAGLLLMFGSGVRAQGHTATGTWVLSADDTTTSCAVAGSNCSQTMYRATGACSASSVFVQQQTLSATATTFSDTTIVPGVWCYAVTFTINGQQSLVFLATNSNFATVTLQPSPQTGLAVAVK